jgi:hypothetical protein
MGLKYILVTLASLLSIAFAFKVKLTTDGKAEFESGFTEITPENMMTQFMDKN